MDPAQARARALAVGCAPLVDAMGRHHSHRAHLPALSSPTPDRVLWGPAVTMLYLPTRDDLPEAERGFGDVFDEAVAGGAHDAVLVMSSGGSADASHAGGVKLTRAAREGLAGVLCDGLLRDFAELAEHDFVTWCRGEAVRWGGDSVMPAAANVPIEVAGVTITPGDFVYADAAGGVVIPAASLGDVLDEAEKIVADDQQWADRLSTGQ